jgi:hypothetical protein
MLRTKAILIAATAFLAACSNTHKHPYDQVTEGATAYVPVRIAHEFYSSWGHDGRGGAALRKPAYQHVMASEDEVMTTQGNYAELRAGQANNSVVVTALNHGMNKAIDQALTFTPPPTTPAPRVTALNASQDEYERAYRKLCRGAGMEMTEREWEIVALGGPKGVPASLRGKCFQVK